jgi:D-serine deaminase-like pyridoxal phosphate-dependent protein
MVTCDALDTPFLTVDLDTVDRNIAAMQAYCDEHDIALRPHVKTHKSPLVARLQLRAGAAGLTCQKLGEGELMVDEECGDDILISFPLVGVRKAARFANLATRTRVSVAADSAVVARSLSSALAVRDASAGFLVDCDTGFGRTGVQTPQAAAELAELVDRLPGLSFTGLMTHPSHGASGHWLRQARRLCEERGLSVGCVSGGGTPTARHTHELDCITELRVGTYVYGDRSTVRAGVSGEADCALHVRATVVSTPTRERVILDAGSKTLTSDPGFDLPAQTFGAIVEYPDAVIYALSEEHGHVDVGGCDRRPEVGEIVTIIPNHACATVNLHSEVAFHRSGGGVTIRPVAGRGLVR